MSEQHGLTLRVGFKSHIANGRTGHHRLRPGPGPQPSKETEGRVPRVARLMALAIHFDGLLRGGVVKTYRDIARLLKITPERVTQIMNLLLLAPDIQEEALFLPRYRKGKHSVTERQLRPIAAIPEWKRQRVLWRKLWPREGGVHHLLTTKVHNPLDPHSEQPTSTTGPND